jgi:hypothetical protein
MHHQTKPLLGGHAGKSGYPIRRNKLISSFFGKMSIMELTGLRCAYESYYWMLTEKEAQGLHGNQTRVKTEQ